MTLYVTSYNSKIPKGAFAVDTTSRSSGWKDLSPFYLGPVKLYDGLESKNFENSWQFSKVYKQHVDEDGEPNEEYWDWAKTGWNSTWAHRYPMGKGAIPEYSLWDGEKLGYIEARKRIYMPLYAVKIQQRVFDSIAELMFRAAKIGQDLYLRDFDGYNHKELGMTYDDVIHCEERKMGHAFVLAMVLENVIECGQDLATPERWVKQQYRD